MATKKKAAKKTAAGKRPVKPVPKGYRTVTPFMNQEDAGATIAFCKDVFGAKVRMVMEGPSGKVMHAEITIGDGVIMMSDAVQEPARAARRGPLRGRGPSGRPQHGERGVVRWRV